MLAFLSFSFGMLLLFAGDQYLAKTKVADFRIYNVCISDKELKKLTK